MSNRRAHKSVNIYEESDSLDMTDNRTKKTKLNIFLSSISEECMNLINKYIEEHEEPGNN